VENLGFDHILSLVLGQKHDAVGGSDDFIHRLRRKKADAAPTLRVTGWPGKAYITKFKISKDFVKSLLAHLAFRFDFFFGSRHFWFRLHCAVPSAVRQFSKVKGDWRDFEG